MLSFDKPNEEVAPKIYTIPRCCPINAWTSTLVCISIGDELINGGRIKM